MTPILIYTSTGTILFCLGLSGLFICNHPFRKILSMNFSGSGIFLVLVAFARRQGEVAIDPVPDALVLTGIVVAVSATAVALACIADLKPSPMNPRPMKIACCRHLNDNGHFASIDRWRRVRRFCMAGRPHFRSVGDSDFDVRHRQSQ
jgi:multicomponent Na+:H+ antiporter subunit C